MEKLKNMFRKFNKEQEEAQKVMSYFELLGVDQLSIETANFVKENYAEFTRDQSEIVKVTSSNNYFVITTKNGEFGLRFEPNEKKPGKVFVRLSNKIADMSYIITFADELTIIDERRTITVTDEHNGVSKTRKTNSSEFINGQLVSELSYEQSIGKNNLEDSSYGITAETYYSRENKESYVRMILTVAEKRSFYSDKNGVRYESENGEITQEDYETLSKTYQNETVKEKKIGTINAE